MIWQQLQVSPESRIPHVLWPDIDCCISQNQGPCAGQKLIPVVRRHSGHLLGKSGCLWYRCSVAVCSVSSFQNLRDLGLAKQVFKMQEFMDCPRLAQKHCSEWQRLHLLIALSTVLMKPAPTQRAQYLLPLIISPSSRVASNASRQQSSQHSKLLLVP